MIHLTYSHFLRQAYLRITYNRIQSHIITFLQKNNFHIELEAEWNLSKSFFLVLNLLAYFIESFYIIKK